MAIIRLKTYLKTHLRGIQEFIVIVLLILFMKNVNLNGYEYRVIELFAGVARIAKVACLRGYRAVALDINFHSVGKTFDVTSSSGYVFLTCTRPTTFRGFQSSGV